MRVLVVGGGIAGLTLAYWLQPRHQPVVVERAPRLRDEGYMMDFFGPGYEVARRMGLLPDLQRIHYEIPRLRFLGGDGRERFSLQYRTLRRTLFGDRHFNFMRGDLERLLHHQIEDRVEIRFGATVETLRQDEAQAHVTFVDGATESFDAVVGADGVHSAVRALAFGEESRYVRHLGYNTAAFILEELPRGGPTADVLSMLTEPGRQVTIYPIRGQRLATFFVFKASPSPKPASPAAAIAELRRAYRGTGWVVPDLLDRGGQTADLFFDAVVQVVMPRWSRGRVMLVGDACQCVSPLAGQGASLAMAGAYVLAQELDACNQDVASAGLQYERRLRPEVERLQRAGRRLAGWFVPSSPTRLLLRDLLTRFATWPIVAPLVRRSMGASPVPL